MSYTELAITDGTTRIDLLAANKRGKGFALKQYTMGRAGFKGNGTWQDSPVATGRQLAGGVKTNYADALTLEIAYPSHGEIILAYETLDGFLDKAVAYWTTTWQQTPVYLISRAAGENNSRYALLHNGIFDTYFDPYHQPYVTSGNMHSTGEFILGIERGPWLQFAPGLDEAVPISHEDSGATIQAVTDVYANEGVILGNMHQSTTVNVTGGLRVIYRYTGSYSANLLDSSPPYNFWNSPAAVDDALYLASDFPFFGVVFDLDAIWGDNGTVAWEFWNGSAWTAITPIGDTTNAAFHDLSISHVQWSPTDVATWTKVIVSTDFDTRYWMRVRVATSPVPGASPRQATRHIYSSATGYVEVADTEIEGTEDALLRMVIGVWSASNATVMNGPFCWVGLRSYDRGANFSAHLNVGGAGGLPGANPANITVTASGGTLTTDPTAPGGGHIAATNLLTLSDVAIFKISANTHKEYYGRFRLFARITSDDNTGASRMRYKITNDLDSPNQITFYTGETKAVPSTLTSYGLVDLGPITLPASEKLLTTDSTVGYRIIVQVLVPSGKTIKVIGLFFLPTDEWAAEITGTIANVVRGTARQINLDGIGNPKFSVRAFDEDQNELTVVSAGVPTIHAYERQRYWILVNFVNASPANMMSIQLNKCERWKALRGDS